MDTIKNPVLSKLGRNNGKNQDATRLIVEDQPEDDDDSLILTQERVDPTESDTDSDGDAISDNNEPTFIRPLIKTTSPYESLDYDVCENKLWEKDQKPKHTKLSVRKSFARWMIFLFIGILTGMVCCLQP